MTTKVFISWSGEQSREIAEVLRDWLPSALQYVKPYFSPGDIEKGTKWGSEIANELKNSNVGIVCLTQDNTEEPWILFEAGALSKSIDESRVCTLLLGMEPADVKPPLASFQATKFVKEDFRRLFGTINNSAEDSKLGPDVLNNVFEKWWPELEAKVLAILEREEVTDQGARRDDRDILEEILLLTRMASQSPRSVSVSTKAVIDLIEGLEELIYMIRDDVSPGYLETVTTRLDDPIRYFCDRSGSRTVTERWAMLRKRYDLGRGTGRGLSNIPDDEEQSDSFDGE